MGHDPIAVAMNHEHRAGEGAGQVSCLLFVETCCDLRGDQGFGRHLQAPANTVLDLFGGVGFVEAVGEEELEEALMIVQPVVAVPLEPAVIVRPRLIEPRQDRSSQGFVGCEPHARSDERGAQNAIRMFGREQQFPPGTRRQPHQDGPLGTGGVHHGQAVRREFLIRIGLGRRWPIREAVAPAIERQDSEVAGEIRHLRLPEVRVDDRPGG